MPQTEHVCIACDPAIVTSKGFWPNHITSSATRTRIKALAKRMIDDGHLAVAEMALAQPMELEQPNATQVNFGLGDKYDALLVPPAWAAENTPRLREVASQLCIVRSVLVRKAWSLYRRHSQVISTQ